MKKYLGIISVVCGLIILGIIVFSYTKELTLVLKEKEVIIEYGVAYKPKVKDLINNKNIEENDIIIKTTLQNEKDKEYPAVGEYQVTILYKKQELQQKVIVKDTTVPTLEKKKDMKIPFGKKSFNYKDIIKYNDLSTCEIQIDDKDVDYNKSGLYQVDAIVKDIYNNQAKETFQVEVEKEIVTQQPTNITSETFVLVKKYIPSIQIDLRYASTNNFTHQKIYDFKDAYLRYGTVKKLQKVQDKLNKQGYGLLIWDGYRPFNAQKKLWSVVSDSRYVANPNKGPGGHNFGNTVDVTLVTMGGAGVTMPTEFDDFSKKADRDYNDIASQAAINNSKLLERVMKANGFKPYVNEWWHYSDTTTYSYVDFQPK